MTPGNMTADTSDSTSIPSGEARGAGEGSAGGGRAGGAILDRLCILVFNLTTKNSNEIESWKKGFEYAMI
jgi:hypothetical protein